MEIMPNEKESLRSRAKKIICNTKFEVQSQSDQVLIFCKSCQSKFKVDEVHLNSQYKAHLSSAKHKKNSESNILQPSISGAFASNKTDDSKDNSYTLKIATAFLEAGIPLWKLRHPSIKQFFLKEHNEVLPSVNTIYKKVDVIYAKTLQKIKDSLASIPYILSLMKPQMRANDMR